MEWRQRQPLRLALVVGLALAWTLLVAGHPPAAPGERILTPHHGTGTAQLVLAFTSWMTMMIAMMLPSLVPWIVAIQVIAGPPGAKSAAGPAAQFLVGTLAAWIPFALIGTVAQHSLAGVLPLDLTGPRRYFGAGVLTLAGAYQLSSLRAACLRHCRSPIAVFLSRWRDGPMGAVELGLRHGAFCLGCCWALMALCFALGAMNLAWMALLTLVVCVEQLAPGGVWFGRALGVGLLALGAGTAFQR
jgi:predicted metal-binding membrane protein